jgi:hypothetical protein
VVAFLGGWCGQFLGGFSPISQIFHVKRFGAAWGLASGMGGGAARRIGENQIFNTLKINISRLQL